MVEVRVDEAGTESSLAAEGDGSVISGVQVIERRGVHCEALVSQGDGEVNKSTWDT